MLLNITMADGSRQFAALPENCSWKAMHEHLGRLPGVSLGDYITDHVTEVWMDFTYEGCAFSVNNQFGEYWFFVTDPACPDAVLQAIIAHCQEPRSGGFNPSLTSNSSPASKG